jgi:hypothetical protein
VQISKVLVNSKIGFYFKNSFFLIFGPADPAARLASQPSRPTSHAVPRRLKTPGRPIQPVSFASSWEIRFPFQITPSRAGRLLPLSLPRGPRLSTSSSPLRRPTPVGIFPAPPLPRAAAPHLGCPRAFTALPHHFPLLIPFKLKVNGP